MEMAFNEVTSGPDIWASQQDVHVSWELHRQCSMGQDDFITCVLRLVAGRYSAHLRIHKLDTNERQEEP